jgi:hypothetical protein
MNIWAFLTALVSGNLASNSRTVRRVARPLFLLLCVGVLIAGFIYAYVVLKAVSERSNSPHVHAHSTH